MKQQLILAFLAMNLFTYGQIAINTTGSGPHTSAMLDVQSTSKGLLVPNMTQTQRNAIVTPANGLMIYQNTEPSGYYYNAGTSGSPDWQRMGGDLVLPFEKTFSGSNASAFSVTSTLGFGISGTGRMVGVSGRVTGTSGDINWAGVLGRSTNTTGRNFGVIGESYSSGGSGIYASNYSPTGGEAIALIAEASSATGKAIFARSLANTGTNYGVYGEVQSADGFSGFFTGGKFAITSNRVGIGTIDPSVNYKLDVAGGMNLNKGIGTGVALSVNGMQVIGYYDNIRYNWGHPENHNFFSGRVFIGTTYTSPGTNRLVVDGTAAKPGGGSWLTWSDARLKNIQSPFMSGLAELSALSPVVYSYTNPNALNFSAEPSYIGFVAQDVQKVLPAAVKEDASGYLTLDMQVIHIAVVNAIKQLHQEIDQLKNENESFRKRESEWMRRIERLEKKLEPGTKK